MLEWNWPIYLVPTRYAENRTTGDTASYQRTYERCEHLSKTGVSMPALEWNAIPDVDRHPWHLTCQPNTFSRLCVVFADGRASRHSALPGLRSASAFAEEVKLFIWYQREA